MAQAKALLIEDDPTDRALIAREFRLLEYISFDLAMARTLSDGIAFLASDEFAVVLLDLSLPDAKGLDGLQTIIKRWPDMAVVVLTGLDDRATAIAALKDGAQDYLVKGAFDSALLLRSIQYAIERSQISAELQHSEQQYRALVAAMTSIVWSTSASGMIDGEQPGWSTYTGQSRDAYQGRGWLNAIHSEQREAAKAFWHTAIGHHGEQEFNWRVWHAESQRHRRCLVRVVPIRQPDSVIREWVATLTDVEDAKQAEEALYRAERLASLGTLAAGIAHEINNPIVAAWSSAQAALNVLDRPSESEMLAECLQNVIRSVERCRDTVAGVLRFARYGEVERYLCDITAIVEHAVQEVAHYAQSYDQSLELSGDDSQQFVNGNEYQIQQVLVTVLRNAIEAGTPGNAVLVTVDSDDHDVVLTVTDGGHGMTETEQQLAFDPFFTSRKAHGTGLGLSIAHGIMESHGGSINLVSEESVGTQCTLRFPSESPPANDNEHSESRTTNDSRS